MQIALTGATGFIGNKLVERLLRDGHTLRLLARRPRTQSGERLRWFGWDGTNGKPPRESLEGAAAVVHLAGEPIAQRWSARIKEKIRASRVEATENLVAAMRDLTVPPQTLISASAIGFYGSRGDEILTEDSVSGAGFLASLCVEWERAARGAESLGTRVVSLRTGVALGHGGALQKMLPPFRAGLGGRLGSGKQWMSWIHIDDLTGLIGFALANDHLRGPVNGTAPQPVTNGTFTHQLAKALHRPAILPVPAFALRLLFGEMSEALLTSLRVLPVSAETTGYHFLHPELSDALRQILA
jgi:uncharacterized protein (TIGR01777 family)